jgi:hypothetical protein
MSTNRTFIYLDHVEGELQVLCITVGAEPQPEMFRQHAAVLTTAEDGRLELIKRSGPGTVHPSLVVTREAAIVVFADFYGCLADLGKTR